MWVARVVPPAAYSSGVLGDRFRRSARHTHIQAPHNPPQEIQSGRATPSGHNFAEVRQLYFSAGESNMALPGRRSDLKVASREP
jgi:hypothetical protein